MSDEVRVEKDITFGHTSGLDLKCDLHYPPEGASKRTAVIHLYGGGFMRGNRVQAADAATFFAQRGYLGVCAWYRLGDVAKWPAQIEDAKAAIRWTRANAEKLGIDPDKIVLAGYSAGGALGLLVAGAEDRPDLEGDAGNAGVSSRVNGVVTYYVGGSLRRRDDGTNHPVMPAGADDAAYHDGDYRNFLKPGFPPTVLLHSTVDTLADFENSVELFRKLREAGTPAELHLFDGLSHVFDRFPEFGDACAHMADLFLDRHVVNPREYPPFQTVFATGPAPSTI